MKDSYIVLSLYHNALDKIFMKQRFNMSVLVEISCYLFTKSSCCIVAKYYGGMQFIFQGDRNVNEKV